AIWLTRSKTRRPDSSKGDVYLGSFNHNGELKVGEFYDNAVTVTIPIHLQGQFFLTVYADGSNGVFESSFDINVNPDLPNDIDGSNIKSTSFTVLYTPPADLEVTDVKAPASANGL